jgi:hypothetical protein
MLSTWQDGGDIHSSEDGALWDIFLDQKELQKSLTLFCEYKDAGSRKEYFQYRSKRMSTSSILAVCFMSICICIPLQITALKGDIQSGPSSPYYLPRVLTAAILLLVSILCGVSGVIMLTILVRRKTKRPKVNTEFGGQKKENFENLVHICGPIFFVASMIYFNIVFVRRISLGCYVPTNMFIRLLGDGICYDPTALPAAISYNTCLVFMAFTLIFTCITNIPSTIAFVSWLLSLVVFVSIVINYGVMCEVGFQPFAAIFSCLAAMADVQYSGVLDYAYTKEIIRLQKSLNKLKEESDALFKEEMRLLVGNVAHDIKSVSGI